MASLKDIVRYCDTLLCCEQFEDYAPNGLQVEGRTEVKKIVAGVTASLALIDAAIAAEADCLLVHHGYFWKGELQPVVGMKRRRLQRLLGHDLSLLAYHLPLDAHPELGNNVALADVLGIQLDGALAGGAGLALCGHLGRACSADAFSRKIEQCLGRKPLHISCGDQSISRVAWCTGAADGYCMAAAVAGMDAYISGEVSEQTAHICREMGIHYYAAGHHATERYGVSRLLAVLLRRFDLEGEFIDIDNPV